ncbi:MAG: asparagine synthetase B, partial [Elusimicrobia bacterium]|nr:asparagine synthetase B [Elusimicrobiota bacterium]MBD3412154.1 asparagine synthetase B [Elusimicrobiota bacterium]
KAMLKNYLPGTILSRRKMGFGIPLASWFRHEPLRSFLKDHVLSATAINRGYFNKEALHKLIDDHEKGTHDHGYRLWCLLILELWHRRFMDQNTGIS